MTRCSSLSPLSEATRLKSPETDGRAVQISLCSEELKTSRAQTRSCFSSRCQTSQLHIFLHSCTPSFVITLCLCMVPIVSYRFKKKLTGEHYEESLEKKTEGM